jgi:hypothetical protein
MSADHLKTPLALSFPSAVNKTIADAIQLTGKALPASVVQLVSKGIVRVRFEVAGPWTLPEVTCTLAGSEYIGLPLQPGCRGVVFPADVSLGGVTGLGSGVADIRRQPANLAALVFFPLGNVDFGPADGSFLVLHGPQGVIVRNPADTVKVTVGANSAIMEATGGSVTVNASGVAINGVLTINGAPYLAHIHGGVTVGAGVSGAVVT